VAVVAVVVTDQVARQEQVVVMEAMETFLEQQGHPIQVEVEVEVEAATLQAVMEAQEL
jgi:CO dehydrogenase/acetyl-CoA synthase beta subunit